jgi:hypothetical protein
MPKSEIYGVEGGYMKPEEFSMNSARRTYLNGLVIGERLAGM